VTVVTPDPRPEARHVADSTEWDRIALAKSGPCRGCGERADSFHHLVPKSLRGDDVPSNIIPVCGDGVRGCHGALECHTAGWEIIAHQVRHSLTPLELQYVTAKKGRAWLERYLPAGETNLCSRCKRPVRAQGPRETPRKRKRIVLTVPDDAEDGAAVWDGLVEAARGRLAPVLGWDSDVGDYFVVVAVLADWLNEGGTNG
jgi:hypothetical protein